MTVAKFTLITKNRGLHPVFEEKDVNGRLVRWFGVITEYCFYIVYRNCKANPPVDYFSRQSMNSNNESEHLLATSEKKDVLHEEHLEAFLHFTVA